MTVTVITEEVAEVDGVVADGQVIVAATALEQAVGWTLKDEGLCRQDVCVPVRDRAALHHDAGIDVVAVATALGRRAVVDADHAVVALSIDAEARHQAVADLRAPSFTLPDLDGNPRSLEEWHGRRRMLFAFSSW